jgi:hypothetical protein
MVIRVLKSWQSQQEKSRRQGSLKDAASQMSTFEQYQRFSASARVTANAPIEEKCCKSVLEH